MRVLLGGVIGAIVATAVWLGLEYYLQKDLGWLACFVGVVTGLCVHKAAGATTPGSYGRGALAVILALAAIVGGRQVYVKFMQAALHKDTVAVAKAAPLNEANNDGAASSDNSATFAPVTDFLPTNGPGHGALGNQNVSFKDRFATEDMIWMCVGALAAYIIGKGRDQVPVSVQKEEQSPEPSDPGETPSE